MSVGSRKSKFPPQNIQIQSCGSLYEKWKSKKRSYRKAPREGLSFDVQYVDTKEMNPLTMSNRADAPVVLALHGAPGHYNDFAPLVDHLAPSGARVIAPNLPNYADTERTGFFRHSAEEKAEFLKDFLKALDVPKIDMLVTHSSGCYPGLLLWQDTEAPPISAVTLINAAGHRRIKAMKPAWYIDGSVRIYLSPLGRWLYRKIAPVLFKAMNVPVKPENIDNVLLSATSMFFAGIERLPSQLDQIRSQNVPLLFVYSENDKLVDHKVFKEMSQMLKATEEQFERYDKEGNLIKKFAGDDLLKVMAFEAGGHYCFLKFADQVNQAIEQHLETVVGSKVHADEKALFNKPVISKAPPTVDSNFESDEERIRVKL